MLRLVSVRGYDVTLDVGGGGMVERIGAPVCVVSSSSDPRMPLVIPADL